MEARVRVTSEAPLSSFATTCLFAAAALDRAAYVELLRTAAGWQVAAESDFRPVNAWRVLRLAPRVVVVTSEHASSEVCDLLHMVQRLVESARVLVIASTRDPGVVEGWSRSPLHGFVSKDAGPTELAGALLAVARGHEFYSPGVHALLTRARTRINGATRLARREEELIPLLARGMTLRDAALSLNISYKTADSYRSSLFKKLGVRDRVDLVRYAIRAGIVEP